MVQPGDGSGCRIYVLDEVSGGLGEGVEIRLVPFFPARWRS